MSIFAALSLVMVLAALFSFVNHRFVRLPTTVGVTLIALVISLLLIAGDALGLPVHDLAVSLIDRLDFQRVVLEGMLAFLLFAGALSLDLRALRGQKVVIGVLASVGVLASTFLVGGITWALGRALDLGISLPESLLFGALISPTDPIAVLGILRAAAVPKDLEAQMAGEALFNDGFAVVVFSVILGVIDRGGGAGAGATGWVPASLPAAVAFLVGTQVIGSLALGVAGGWLTFVMLRAVDNYQVEVLLTLALAMGLYSLASALHTSGPLAVVVAGLIIGGQGRAHAMSRRTVEHVDTFWELVDGILNVVLFVLIGFEVLVLPLSRGLLLMGLAAAAVVLLARYLSVGAAVTALRPFHRFPAHAIKLLTWGGLRGGLSLAMALSLGPHIASRHAIQAVTYVVAVFSIAVQGLSFGRLLRATAGHGDGHLPGAT
jgi:CPA1 family monovalent cation:H+ antiporter